MIILRAVPIVALLLASPWASAQANTPAGRVYCCADAAGRRICGDTLPAACYDRAYREVSPGGRVLRDVEAPLTPEQRARRDQEIRVQRERAARDAEANRRDQVLLDSYANVGELDARRDRELANMEADLQRNRTRETELLNQRVRLEKLVPAKGAVPREISEDLGNNAAEVAATRTVIESKQRDIDLARARFDADRKRFLELTAQDRK
ncbi:MAG: hypothetical protein QM639_00335 [Rhodocyclaceae bacterium]